MGNSKSCVFCYLLEFLFSIYSGLGVLRRGRWFSGGVSSLLLPAVGGRGLAPRWTQQGHSLPLLSALLPALRQHGPLGGGQGAPRIHVQVSSLFSPGDWWEGRGGECKDLYDLVVSDHFVLLLW